MIFADKLIRLSELFEVSTDYLLKDEIEDVEYLNFSDEAVLLRRVSMEEANAFLLVKATTSKSIAYAVFLCILSPICLLVLGAISDTPKYGLSDRVSGGIGIIVLLILVAIAVAIFISSGSKTAAFEYLEKEVFETAYGVSGMAKEQKEKYKHTYNKKNIIGACLCIMSFIPLFAGGIFNEENNLLLTLMLSVSFVLAGMGVVFFIRNGIIWSSYEKLLQEGDYSKEKKLKSSVTNTIGGVYWIITTAIYLAYSLTTNNWGYSFIIFSICPGPFSCVMLQSNHVIFH